MVYTDRTNLNDTGITNGGNYTNKDTVACSEDAVAGQDCRDGRDAMRSTLTKVGGGDVGFDFTRLGSDGAPLALQNVAWNDSGSEEAGSRWACVRDNVTGLVWEVKDNDGGIHDKDTEYQGGVAQPWGGDSDAADRGDYHDGWNPLVNGSNREALCGLANWRMPTVGELATLIHYGKANHTIDTNYFPNTPKKWYWSATPHPTDNAQAMAVSFLSYGAVTINGRDATDPVRLVSGVWERAAARRSRRSQVRTHHHWLPNTTPNSRYVNNGKGIVTDRWTGLMWQRCAAGITGADCTGGTATELSWQDALAYANNSTISGHSDWRLPNIKELRSLVAYDRHTPAINATLFPNTSGQFWSSSQRTDTTRSSGIDLLMVSPLA